MERVDARLVGFVGQQQANPLFEFVTGEGIIGKDANAAWINAQLFDEVGDAQHDGGSFAGASHGQDAGMLAERVGDNGKLFDGRIWYVHS